MIYVPWLLAVITAGCFALMARRAGRGMIAWGLTGAVIAWITATIVLGLGQATNNPFSNQELQLLRIKWVIEAILTIAVLAWFFTMPLHRHHLALWRRATGKATPPPPPAPAPAAETKPKPEAPKQASKA